MKTFVDVVKEYSAWKLQEKGNGKLTRKELVSLREKFTKSSPKRIVESKNDWTIYLTNYKKFKESKDPTSKITYKELKLLKENFKEAQVKRIRLREADAGFDPAAQAQQQPVMDPNAAMGAPAPTQVDPTVAAQIQDVVQSVNALAASAGVQVNDLGADPAAGTPAVDGMQPPAAPVPGDPNAGAMMESMMKSYSAWKKENYGVAKLTEAEIEGLKKQVFAKLAEKKSAPKSKYEQIKERIAARNAKMKELNEGVLDIPTTAEMGTLTSKPAHSNSQGGDHSTSEEQVKVPTAGQLANGYTSGKAAGETKAAKTWPTKAMGKEAGGALQGAGATQTKVKEAEECEKEEDKLEEGVKTVTDVYVSRYMEPKLNFESIRESMKSGLLG